MHDRTVGWQRRDINPVWSAKCGVNANPIREEWGHLDNPLTVALFVDRDARVNQMDIREPQREKNKPQRSRRNE